MTPSSSLAGIGSMILAAGLFVANDTCMKLAMEEAPPVQVLFLRGIAACLWCLPLILVMGHGRSLPQLLDKWVLMRAGAEVAAVLSFVVALAHMAIGDITAITQTTPLLILIGVALIWREPIGYVRLVLIVIGFVGAILVARPGSGATSALALLGFLAAMFSALRDIAGRNIHRDIPIVIATFATLAIVMIAAGLYSAAFESMAPVTHRMIRLMVLAGFLLIFGHVFIFLAYRFAAPRTIAPFYYCFTVWAVVSGMIVFGELPDIVSLIGMALIVASGLAIAIIDGRRRAAARRLTREA
ncbi:MAG: DMT family transporter [Rhizobiales bacterium]|nr:DMT family transporter [Hyphomicrobiales bacterium]